MSGLFFLVAGLVAVRLVLDGVITVFADRRIYKAGYYRVLVGIGVFAAVLGLVATLIGA